MSVHLTIDEIVLEGFNLPSASAAGLQTAIASQLRNHLQNTPNQQLAGLQPATHLQAQGFAVSTPANTNHLGGQIAGAISRGLLR